MYHLFHIDEGGEKINSFKNVIDIFLEKSNWRKQLQFGAIISWEDGYKSSLI